MKNSLASSRSFSKMNNPMTHMTHIMTRPKYNNDYVTSDLKSIRQGGICVIPNFIDNNEISALRQGIQLLRQHDQNISSSSSSSSSSTTSYFQPSGLSNRNVGDQNEFGRMDRLTCTIDRDNQRSPDYEFRRRIDERLLDLSKELLLQTDASTSSSFGLEDSSSYSSSSSLILAEQYYSISPPSTFLSRHMDERHEETKGESGWTLPTRRSVSWLLYLNDESWNFNIHGGALRFYCHRPSTTTTTATGASDCCCSCCGSHQGNLQVGWLPHDCLELKEHGGRDDVDGYDPIFLDSWIPSPNEERGIWEAQSALYRLRPKKCSSESISNSCEREYLSNPFGPNSDTWPSDVDDNTIVNPNDFTNALRLQFSSTSHQKSFHGMEDDNIISSSSEIDIVDINPTGGSLVLFDSMTFPHEVLPVKQQQQQQQNLERIAMAGWFHEPIQDFPDWYGDPLK